MTYAVLTGDFIDSTALPPARLDAAMTVLQSAATDARGWPGVTDAHFSRRGGDGWQIALAPPLLGLRLVLYLTARLRRDTDGLRSRIALAEGAGTMPDSGDTNAAHGPAFTASGRLLEDLPRGTGLGHAAGGPQAATLILADHLATHWTEAQARALCEVLPPEAGPRSAAAERLGISRQAVDQALKSAGFGALAPALTAWETR